jgi:hypothetical protein
MRNHGLPSRAAIGLLFVSSRCVNAGVVTLRKSGTASRAVGATLD